MIYLDNAATTFPKPPLVLQNVADSIRIYGGNPGRSGHRLSLKTSQKVYEIREEIAQFFGVSVEQAVFTSNCTHALNFAIKGVMAGGGHIILSDLEHNSVIRPIYALKQNKKLDYDIAETCEGDSAQTLANFEKLIRPNTKAIVCTHASNVTGMILPIRELGAMCHKYKILFIVDGAQSAGVLPVNLPDMNIDIFCTAGHKGLYGATGTGLMLLNTSVPIDTLMEGGTGSVSVDLAQPDFLPDRFESGTINTTGILSLGGGLKHVKRLGLEHIYSHEFSLCKELYDSFQNNSRIETYIKQYKKHEFAPVVLCNVQGKSSLEVVEKLSNKGYCLRGGLHCSPLAHQKLGTTETGAVRISPSIFTTRREIGLFLKDFNEILKE